MLSTGTYSIHTLSAFSSSSPLSRRSVRIGRLSLRSLLDLTELRQDQNVTVELLGNVAQLFR